VFLVGGFGKSEYMFKKVQEYCVARGLETRRPPFPYVYIIIQFTQVAEQLMGLPIIVGQRLPAGLLLGD
jgi:hypothetical protein